MQNLLISTINIMDTFIMLSALFGWAVIACWVAILVAKQQTKDEETQTAQPLSTAYKQLRHEGQQSERKKRKTKHTANLIRRSFLALALFTVSLSCAPVQQIPPVPTCEHEMLLIDKTTDKDKCRLCGHTQ